MTGSETRCPVCRTDGLVVWEREERDVLPDLRGIPYCECPHCKTAGEFPELVAQATSRGTEDTVRELRRLGELDAGVRDGETYCARKAAQAEVDAHLSACTDRMRQAPHLGNVRAGLSIANLRQLPPDTGLHVRDNAPRQFALLGGPRYARTNMTLYRYRFDGETTCVDAQNPKTLQREHRIRIVSDVGVYLGNYRFGEVPQVMVGTHDPRIAAQVYGAWRAETTLPSPVVGIAGFPLPRKFEAVRTLYLMDAPDNPLPLEFAVSAFAGPVVYGGESPAVKVLSPRCQSSDITAADVRMLSNSAVHGKPLHAWLTEKLLSMADRREEVANALLQAGASEAVRTELAELLGESAPRALLDTVLLPTAEPDDIIMLGNGKLLKVTPVGIYTAYKVPRTGEIASKTLLCNVGLVIESRVVDRGLEIAVCTVTHPDADVSSVTVRIPRTHWTNCDAMAEDIRAAWAECGRTPYVAFYRVGGYAWADIMQLLGAHCPVQTGIKSLGATPDGDVNFPGFSVSRGRTEEQTKTGLIPDATLAAYSAIERDFASVDTEGLVRFLAAPVGLRRTGVAAGMLHALYCAAGTMFDQSGVRRPPAHLIFVETEPGIWDSTIRTLAYLFSGSEYVPLMDYADGIRFVRDWAGLGTLPLITRLPSVEDMAVTLAESPVPVIAISDPLTALGCSGHANVTFVLPHVETADHDQITSEEITALRKAFAAKVCAKAGTGWQDLSPGSPLATATPVLSVLGDLYDGKDRGTVASGLFRSVKSRYPGIGLTGAKTFFAVLHREYTAHMRGDTSSIHVTMVSGEPGDTLLASFNERGEHVFVCAEHVIVSRAVVGIINHERTFLFDAEQLSHEFEENGILLKDTSESLGIDGNRIWVFPRTIWESEVVRATGFNEKRSN